MKREELIYELTKYELEYFSQNNDQSCLMLLAGFFAKGGFITWSDESLQKKYELFIAEEKENA
jgi:hypothetical protein